MRRSPVLAVSVAACLLLGGCFGSGGDDQASSPRHHRPTSRSTTGDVPSGSDSTPTATSSTSSPAATASALRFSPRSDGRHNRECLLLHPGDDPAEFLYYPVLVKASGQVSLDQVTTVHSQGVVVAGAWVAPAPQTPGTGTLPGWPPPKIFTSSSSVQWSQRVAAAGATLDPSAGWYNVFLRIQVDPTPGDSTMSGVVLRYHDAGGDHSDTWVDHVTFSMSC
jgi:hypothetical protein